MTSTRLSLQLIKNREGYNMYNIANVKKQIKTAGKDRLLYNADQHYVSNAHYIINVEDFILPAILDACKTITNNVTISMGNVIQDAKPFDAKQLINNTQDRANNQLQVTGFYKKIDKKEYTVLLRADGEMVAISREYYDMIASPEDCIFKQNNKCDPIIVSTGTGEFVMLVCPCKINIMYKIVAN